MFSPNVLSLELNHPFLLSSAHLVADVFFLDFVKFDSLSDVSSSDLPVGMVTARLNGGIYYSLQALVKSV